MVNYKFAGPGPLLDEWVRYLVKCFWTGIVTGLESAGSKQGIRRSSDRCAAGQHYTPDHPNSVVEKENPYRANQSLEPTGLDVEDAIPYLRRRKKGLGHGWRCTEVRGSVLRQWQIIALPSGPAA